MSVPHLLSKIIDEIKPERVLNFEEHVIEGISIHPDSVRENFLFACIDEFIEYNQWRTSHAYHEQLPTLGLKALLCSEPLPGLAIPQLVVKDVRASLGLVARMLTGMPDRKIRLVGVTGTNGKTTTTKIISYLLNQLGTSAGSLGTLGFEVNLKQQGGGSYTTPLAPELMEYLDQAIKMGVDTIAMEVSSHALELGRVYGLEYMGAVLTQIERDHLDFHGTEAAYLEAKLKLFRQVRTTGIVCLNANSKHYKEFVRASGGRIISYGIGKGDYKALEVSVTSHGTEFMIQHFDGELIRVKSRLIGRFQVENLLGAIAYVCECGHLLDAVIRASEGFERVAGRMERYVLPNGSVAIIDYAHNPDGLKNLLENCRALKTNKIHLVFGCGGDRDKGKRPLMGKVASEHADVCWITSDNPRTEEPEMIMNEIVAGLDKQTKRYVIENRSTAILEAYRHSVAGDIIIIAGKGHEDYQIIGVKKIPYSDQGVIGQIINTNP